MSLSKLAERPAKAAATKPAAAKTARDFVKRAPKPRRVSVTAEGTAPAPEPTKSAKLEKSLKEAGAAGSFEGVSNAALQEILAAAVHEYGSRMEMGGDFKPFPARRHVTATDCMMTCTAMLKAVGLQLFELGMWQAWSGKH